MPTSPQQAGHVRRLLAERANAIAYDQQTRVEAVDKQLAELGYHAEQADAPEPEPEPERGPAKQPPKGRAPRRRQTTAA